MKVALILSLIAVIHLACEKELWNPPCVSGKVTTDCYCTIISDYPPRAWYRSIDGGENFQELPDLSFDPKKCYSSGMFVRAGLFDVDPYTGKKKSILIEVCRGDRY